MRLDGWASETQYLAHLAPIWLALPAEVRGTLYALQHVQEPRGLPQPLPGLVRGPQRPSGPDPVLVASWADHQGVAPARTVFVEHGAGQAYTDSTNGCYSGGEGRDRAVLFVVPNRHVAARNSARYPQIPNAIAGCPKLDRYHRRSGVEEPGRPREPHELETAGSNPATATTAPFGGRAATSGAGRRPLERPTFSSRSGAIVAVSFHWNDPDGPPERRSAWAHYEPVLAEVAQAFPGALGHAHPRWFGQLAWPLERAGLEPVADFEEVVERADLYACDNSSTIFEWAALDRPTVVLNAPWYRREVDLWPRFWACADVGLQCDEPGDLVARIGQALADTPAMRTNRLRAVHDVYASLDGRAAERAAAAIVHRLTELDQETSVPDPTEPLSAIPQHEALPAPTHPPIPVMRMAGASDAEVLEAQRLWADMSEADRWQATEWINSLSIEELAEHLAEGRLDRPPQDPNVPPEGTVAEVREWIGTDPDRARLAYDREQERKVVRPGVTDYAAQMLRG